MILGHPLFADCIYSKENITLWYYILAGKQRLLFSVQQSSVEATTRIWCMHKHSAPGALLHISTSVMIYHRGASLSEQHTDLLICHCTKQDLSHTITCRYVLASVLDSVSILGYSLDLGNLVRTCIEEALCCPHIFGP